MGLISLPIMLRYGYDRRIASGVIAASGTLAQIIPPSLVLIVIADQKWRKSTPPTALLSLDVLTEWLAGRTGLDYLHIDPLKIDFTGVFENLWFYNGRIAQPPASPAGEPPQTTFAEIGAGFKDGLPLKPWARELYQQRKASNAKDNPDAYCLPMGLMQFHIHPQPRKIVQTPGLIVILYEGNVHGYRQIFMDGRQHDPNVKETYWGDSIGHWEGDTLVVDTVGLGFGDGRTNQAWLDADGHPRTNKLHVIERFTRPEKACNGCGKIDYPDEILNQRLSVDECLGAADECGATRGLVCVFRKGAHEGQVDVNVRVDKSRENKLPRRIDVIAGAVAPDETDLVAGTDAEGDVLHEEPRPGTDFELVGGDHEGPILGVAGFDAAFVGPRRTAM